MTGIRSLVGSVWRAAVDAVAVSAVAVTLLAAHAGAQVTPPPSQSTVPMTRADSTKALFRRAQRMVNDGQGVEARALVDSVLGAAEPRSPEEAEALFWKATLAESWESAQREYLRIMLEHELSPRAGDAMLRLAQGEAARGDREAAIRYLERLAREAPESGARAEGGLWHGRLLLEGGQRDSGCEVMRRTRSLVRSGSVELENQYEFLLRGCPEPGAEPAPPVAPVASGNSAPTNPAAASAPSARSVDGSAAASRWSVQIAALKTSAEATAMVNRLRARGYAARVEGTVAPFRVRFGRYPTRAAAVTAAEAYRTKEKGAAFVVEVPRG